MNKVFFGDCRDVMRDLIEQGVQVDSVVTDPPYEFGFMGKKWDSTGIAFNPEVWKLALQLLKPGGHLLAFVGSRTYHRIACAIEDAGFEVRDQIMWIYGSGFPKSLNVAKAIESGGGRPEDIRRMAMGDNYEASGRGRVNYDHGAASAMNGDAGAWEPTTDAARQWQGWGTALKPAHEPIVVARKPLIGTVAENVLRFGTGAINIDASRVHGEDAQGGKYTVKRLAPGASINKDGNWKQDVEFVGEMKPGRWPANVIHDGSDEVLAAFPDAPGQMADASSSSRKTQNAYGAMKRGNEAGAQLARGDTGSAARFFYCAKTTTEERKGSKHPTIKPTDLMRYLCRLVTPPGGLVLDPFGGSGSTGIAAIEEGMQYILIEKEPEHVADIDRRMSGTQRGLAL